MADYITIIKGDDTNFVDDQFIVINFNTPIDLSGFTATFQLEDVVLTYGDLSSKRIEIILNKDITANLSKGKLFGELKLIDKQHRIRTLSSVIPFLVQDSVKNSPSYINNELSFVTQINNESIDILLEIGGITRSEAELVKKECENSRNYCESYMNHTNTLLSQANQCVEVCTEKATNLIETVDLATEQANIATEQAELATREAAKLEYGHVLYDVIGIEEIEVPAIILMTGTTYEVID